SEISQYAIEGYAKRGIKVRASSTPIIPIYTYDYNNTLVTAKLLFDNGVYVNPVLPPATPANECLLRTSYMASHTEEILDEAMDIIAETLKRREII
ncbi:MAG: 8-amino-7-oxononanoate synthase, partial [Ruminococcaceae bacterium]|nr:8-amino-7-oxononanoate synthase [Oscillospiraceae bacterium]